MKKLSVLGLLAGTALLSAVPISLELSSQHKLSVSLDSANAEIGRPLTPGSIAGVHRRAERRTVRRGYYGAAVAAGAAGAYHGGYDSEPYDGGYDAQQHYAGYGSEQYSIGYPAEPYAGGDGSEQHYVGYGSEQDHGGYAAEPYAGGYGAEQHYVGYGSEQYHGGYELGAVLQLRGAGIERRKRAFVCRPVSVLQSSDRDLPWL